MKAVHILTLIFVALLLHSISKDYLKGIFKQNPYRPMPPQQLKPYPSQVPHPVTEQQLPEDTFPTTIPMEVSMPPSTANIMDDPWDYKDVVSA